jgi:hypothetical protein
MLFAATAAPIRRQAIGIAVGPIAEIAGVIQNAPHDSISFWSMPKLDAAPRRSYVTRKKEPTIKFDARL